MITLTDKAAARVKAQIEKFREGDEVPMGIRIGLRSTGCSGYAYTIDYVDAIIGKDAHGKPLELICNVCNDVSVFIEEKHKPLLEGLQLDYVRKGLNEGFEFSNPNEKARCGCGESVSL